MFGHQAFANVAVCFYRPILLAGLFLLSSAALAAPQTVDCHDLIDGAHKTGLVPTVTSDPDWGIVRISTSELTCREPVEVWNQRKLPWPVEIMPGSEAPKLFRGLAKAQATIKEVEKPAPVEPEAIPVAPVEPEAIPVAPVEPEPVPPQYAPTTDEVVSSPEPVVIPYPSGTNQNSIISEPVVTPKLIAPITPIAPEEGFANAPSLADLVQSRMRLGAEETKDESIIKEEPKQSGVPYLWIGLLVIGLVAGGAFLFFYRRSSNTKNKDNKEDKEENEEDDH